MEFAGDMENQTRVADKKRIVRVNRLLICMLLSIIPALYILQIYSRIDSSTTGRMAVTIIVSQAIILCPAIIYLLCFRNQEKGTIPLEKMKIASILIAILMTFLLYPLITVINALSMFFTENVIAESVGEIESLSLAAKLFMIAFLPGVGEELFFRGIVYRAYRKKSPIKALLLSSFLFGIFHGNLNQFIYAFVLGIIFVFALEATGNIVIPMIMHFVLNGTNIVILHFASNSAEVETATETAAAATQSELMMAILAMLPLVVVACAGAYGLYCVMLRIHGTRAHLQKIFSVKERAGSKSIAAQETILTQKEMKWQNRIITPCLILFIIYYIFTMLVSQFS